MILSRNLVGGQKFWFLPPNMPFKCQLAKKNLFQAVSVIKSLGGNVKMLVTNPKDEEASKDKKPEGIY